MYQFKMSLPHGYSLIPFSCLKLLEPQLWGLITDDMSISHPFQNNVEQVCLNDAQQLYTRVCFTSY